MTDEAVGPRLFIAPELEDGRVDKVSTKSDVYSMGKILYWLLSGGKSFSREKHRQRNWDLKDWNEDSLLGWNNIYMEHVNRILDFMIAEDPQQRRDLDNICILTRRAAKLIEKERPPISKSIRQPCQYCGQGFYVMRAKDNISVHNFGFTPIGAPDWRILVCNTCGHVQAFRVEMADMKEWWSD